MIKLRKNKNTELRILDTITLSQKNTFCLPLEREVTIYEVLLIDEDGNGYSTEGQWKCKGYRNEACLRNECGYSFSHFQKRVERGVIKPWDLKFNDPHIREMFVGWERQAGSFLPNRNYHAFGRQIDKELIEEKLIIDSEVYKLNEEGDFIVSGTVMNGGPRTLTFGMFPSHTKEKEKEKGERGSFVFAGRLRESEESFEDIVPEGKYRSSHAITKLFAELEETIKKH